MVLGAVRVVLGVVWVLLVVARAVLGKLQKAQQHLVWWTALSIAAPFDASLASVVGTAGGVACPA